MEQRNRKPMITLDGKTPRYGWKWEDASARAHYDKWEEIAQLLGIDNLIRLMPASPEKITEALGGDQALNNIPLGQWDARDYGVRALAHGRGGFRSWSLSDSVCALKHVARYHVAKATPPAPFTDEDARSDETHNTTTGYHFWCSQCFAEVFGFRDQHKEHTRGVYSPALK